ncbi:MAG TPA: hypothetical protein VFX33_14625 [Actinomycetales bacterium]|nr:hypothetical protein [Actinomycetales bacterium]
MSANAAKEQAAQAVRDAKQRSGVTWAAIAQEIGRPKEWTTAALLGQHPLTEADVYGPAIKELIHEEFGDGIMSAINFKVDVARRQDPDGDRVVVTFDGKFLDYRW